MKRIVIATWIAAGLSCAACASDDSESSPSDEPGPGKFAPDYRSSAAFFTQTSKLLPGNSPHGASQIWYSSNLKPLISEERFSAPEGTVSIKEFDANGDGKLDGLAVMIKREPGYDPENGDWYYDMRTVAGEIMPDPPPGKISMCVGCHGQFKDTDYLGGTELR
jgi:hypothetical protein